MIVKKHENARKYDSKIAFIESFGIINKAI